MTNVDGHSNLRLPRFAVLRFRFSERADFVHEFRHVPEFLVHARKTNVRHLVHRAESLHDRLAETSGRLQANPGNERAADLIERVAISAEPITSS